MSVRPSTWGLIGSICLHATLAVLALNMAWEAGLLPGASKPAPPPPPAQAGQPQVAPEPARPPGEPKSQQAAVEAQVGDLNKLLQEQKQYVEGLSPERRKQELDKRVGQAVKIPVAHVEGAAGLIEAVAGVDRKRAYAPREGVGGTFDHNTGVIHDIVKTADKDGKTIYQWHMVDAAGRSLKFDMKEREMQPSDLELYRIHEMGRSNPGLKRLLEAANKLGAAMQEKQAAGKADERK